MNIADQRSLLAIALFAAFADGEKAEAEREEIRRIAASLAAQGTGPEMADLYQDVLLKRISVAGAADLLSEPGYRQLAYEMAVCVCDADGRQTEPERRFLAELKRHLGLGEHDTDVFDQQAEGFQLALPAQPAASPAQADIAVAPAAAAVAQNGFASPPQAGKAQADLDRSILNYAVLNGALELLPQSWASMAIIPLQVKMVYGIGHAYGVALDQGHVREFIAAAGVGLSSQYIEQFGRKLLGGLLGKLAGRSIGGLGSAATGMAFSFATTYALGQVAKRYYSGGRVMSTALLKDSFQSLLEPARQLQGQYLPQIQQKAATLSAADVMAMVRGQS